MPARLGAVLCVFASSGILLGCMLSYPNGVVRNSAEAIAIADRECESSLKYYSGPWHVHLRGDEWWLYMTPEAGLQILINARTGKTNGCVVVTD